MEPLIDSGRSSGVVPGVLSGKYTESHANHGGCGSYNSRKARRIEDPHRGAPEPGLRQ